MHNCRFDILSTWSCVSLQRPTTLSEWKVVGFTLMVNDFPWCLIQLFVRRPVSKKISWARFLQGTIVRRLFVRKSFLRQKKHPPFLCYVFVFLCRLVPICTFLLKGLPQAKIIKKSVILFWLLNMTIWCKHVHRLELQKLFNFCAVHLPVRLDIETKFLISNYWQPCQKLEIREFRLYI